MHTAAPVNAKRALSLSLCKRERGREREIEKEKEEEGGREKERESKRESKRVREHARARARVFVPQFKRHRRTLRESARLALSLA